MVSYVMFAKHHDNFGRCWLVICNICDLSRFVKMAPYNKYIRKKGVTGIVYGFWGSYECLSGQSGGFRSQSSLKHRVLLID